MDIIAAHQQGLIEQLEEDVRALAGRTREHGQRAVVLHHLYDHSRKAHQWALVEARRELAIASGLIALHRRLDRWSWLSANPEAARAALAQLADALGEASRRRCAAACRAYRLSAMPALRGQADADLPAELLAALDRCHEARRAGAELSAEAIQQLADLSERHAAEAVDPEPIDLAWTAVAAAGLPKAARRRLGEKALARFAGGKRRRNWGRLEAELRADPMMPAPFRANPAQHYFALQLALTERRRQQWRDACDREPDAFELAA